MWKTEPGLQGNIDSVRENNGGLDTIEENRGCVGLSDIIIGGFAGGHQLLISAFLC